MNAGTVNDVQRKWVPANEFDVNHPDFTDGKHYMTMIYEARSIDLDLVEAPVGHVVTGVRLRKLGGHLNLEVRVRKLSGFWILAYCFKIFMLTVILDSYTYITSVVKNKLKFT